MTPPPKPRPHDQQLRVVPPTATSGSAEQVAADASPPELIDLAAAQRDEAALARDERAAARDAAARDADAEQLARDRMFAARDRAAAALDRREAALDRERAASYLRDAYRDALTGALSREAGYDQLDHVVARAHRADEPVVFAFLDVDRLKQVNDTSGHAAGDVLLRAVGDSLRRGLRSYDVIVRYGGDEFVCALLDLQVEAAARRFGDIRMELARAITGATFSVGLVQLRATELLDEVVARADRAMYAGRRGRAAAP